MLRSLEKSRVTPLSEESIAWVLLAARRPLLLNSPSAFDIALFPARSSQVHYRTFGSTAVKVAPQPQERKLPAAAIIPLRAVPDLEASPMGRSIGRPQGKYGPLADRRSHGGWLSHFCGRRRVALVSPTPNAAPRSPVTQLSARAPDGLRQGSTGVRSGGGSRCDTLAPFSSQAGLGRENFLPSASPAPRTNRIRSFSLPRLLATS